MTAERCQGDGFNIAQNEWWTIKKGRKGGYVSAVQHLYKLLFVVPFLNNYFSKGKG